MGRAPFIATQGEMVMKFRNPSGWSYLAFAVALVLAGGAVRAQKPATPGAREIVDRFIREAGGEAAFKAIKSFRAKGTLTFSQQNMTGEVETMSARPSKSITRATIVGLGKVEEGFDGKVGWSIDPVQGPTLVTGRALIERADSAWFDAPMRTPEFVREMTVVGKETFDKREAYRVKVVLKSGTEEEDLYDVETGMKIGEESKRETPYGVAPTTTIFRDYKQQGKVKVAMVHVTRILGFEQVVTFVAYEFDTVPANTFDLPPAIKALIK